MRSVTSFQEQCRGGRVWVAVVCGGHSAGLGAGSSGGNGPAEGQVTWYLEWLHWNLLGNYSALLATKKRSHGNLAREVVFLRRISGKPNPNTLFLKL